MAADQTSLDDAAIRRELRHVVEHSRKLLAEELAAVRRELSKIPNCEAKLAELDKTTTRGDDAFHQMMDYIEVSRRPLA